MDTIFMTFRAEVKGVDRNEGTVDMFIPVSTDSVDRDGEMVHPTAFKKTLPKFMKRPVLVASHDYRDLTSLIGEWSKLKITDNGLEGKPKYYVNAGNKQADWGFYLASKGMAAFSIGFIPKEWEDGDGVKSPRRTYKEVELLEISQVIVPSNREAIQSIRSKGVDSVTEKLLDDVERELVTKPEETDEYIRIPVDRGDHEGHRIRTIDISEKEGIKAIYCGTDKVVMTYLFAKDKGWDMEKARAWVKEHAKNVLYWVTLKTERDITPPDYEKWLAMLPTPDRKAKTSQLEIIDEIDYLKSLIEKEGLSEDAKQSATELIKIMCSDDLVRELAKRLPADDIAVKDNFTNQDILESIKRIGGK